MAKIFHPRPLHTLQLIHDLKIKQILTCNKKKVSYNSSNSNENDIRLVGDHLHALKGHQEIGGMAQALWLSGRRESVQIRSTGIVGALVRVRLVVILLLVVQATRLLIEQSRRVDKEAAGAAVECLVAREASHQRCEAKRKVETYVFSGK